MIHFSNRCRDCALAETLVLHIQESGLPLLPGEYQFRELYCDDARCDCRRTLLEVTSPQHPGRILAYINYGWESTAFYTQWMHGDEKAGREIASASLDPINPQSEFSEALLEGLRDYLRRESSLSQQLQRHYEMFKGRLLSTSGTAATPALTTTEILHQLQYLRGPADFAPYEAALRAACVQGESLTPDLIASLDQVTANPAQYSEQRGDCLYLFAICLLAQFRETRALDTFLRFFSLPGEQSLDLTGDMVTEAGAAILASVCGGDPAPLLRLALDESVNEFVREQAIKGLLVQHGWGERSRDAVLADLRRLFQELRRPDNYYMWAALVGAVCDFDATELLPEARRAFADGLVDETVIGLKDIELELGNRADPFPRLSGEERFQELVDRNAPIDAVDLCSGWLCFRGKSESDDWTDDDSLDDAPPPQPQFLEPTAPAPYVAPPKVGRNDPCVCGSGRKFKKCCGGN